MKLLIQGFILGLIIVLPGMSGGTVLLIFGIYKAMVSDLLNLRFKKYIPFAMGIAVGIYVSGYTFAVFFEHYRDFTALFLLGCLLASTKAVLNEAPKVNTNLFIFLVIGLCIGVATAGEPIGTGVVEDLSWWILMIGGALSTAAMIIPGVPGSSILILMGIFDSILFSIAELQFSNLLFFGIGSILGIVLLLKILETLFKKYKPQLSYLFTGLIIGSARILLPNHFTFAGVAFAMVGFSIVYYWTIRECRKEMSREES